MIPERGAKGHGEDQAISIRDVYEAVLYRGAVPGISGGLAVGNGIYLSEMRCQRRCDFVILRRTGNV